MTTRLVAARSFNAQDISAIKTPIDETPNILAPGHVGLLLAASDAAAVSPVRRALLSA
jgi:hypothetical protein